MLTIDGSHGEGGGQILRTALALSSVLDRPFRMVNIRRNRKNPGLRPQHLTAVRAAKTVAAAEAAGDNHGSTELTFIPHRVTGGRFSFDTGTAGSTTLVLQAVLPMLLLCGERSSVTLTGGTHNPMSPSYHYLERIFAPLIGRIGCSIGLNLSKCGFYPRGGGVIHAETRPVEDILPLDLANRGSVISIRGISAVANLPVSIAERQKQEALSKLENAPRRAEIELVQVSSPGRGTFLFMEAVSERAVAGFTALGALGKPAEEVGREGAAELQKYLTTGAALDPHAADQLVLYLAFCHTESILTTSAITSHLVTNLWLIEQFHEVRYTIEGNIGQPGTVRMTGARKPT